MARNIYESKHNRLKELKQARNKELFVEEIYKLARQVNQRLYRLEKKNVGISDSAYRYAQRETGKEKPRYSTNKKYLGTLTIQELYELGIQLNSKIISKTSTIKGLKEIRQRRLEMSLYSLHKDLDITSKDITKKEEEEWARFLEQGGGELMNNKYLDSYQIREDWYNFSYLGGVSLAEFINTYKEMLYDNSNNVDYGLIRRSFINLME